MAAQTERTATDRAALRDRIAEALTAAAFECDGKCGLSEQDCYDAHPITFSALSNGTTHVNASVTALADAALAALPASVDRATVLREAADICDEAGAVYGSRGANDAAGAAFALMERFQRKANEAEYVATPCSVGGCEPGGEPCSTHERLMAHAEGDHELCAPDCGVHPVVLPAAVDRAAVLREEAARIRAHCPDHLDADSAEGAWTDCHCPVADDMERRVAAATPDEAKPWLSDSARIGRALIWSWTDIGKGAFGEGYRAAQAEARALLGGKRGTDADATAGGTDQAKEQA